MKIKLQYKNHDNFFDDYNSTVFHSASVEGPCRRPCGRKSPKTVSMGPHTCETENSNLFSTIRKKIFFEKITNTKKIGH